MAYISQVQITNDSTYLIEPLLFATAGGTSTALTAAIANFSLVTGASVQIKVGTVNANATLSVNGTTAKSIYYNGANIKNNILISGNVYMFTYDGTYWQVMGGVSNSNLMMATTAQWAARNSYVAPEGTVIVYTDHETYTNNNTTITVPGIKISDGLAYVTDLPFIDDAVVHDLTDHLTDTVRHITSTERTFWNNKLNYDLSGETLILNRL